MFLVPVVNRGFGHVPSRIRNRHAPRPATEGKG